MTKEQRKRAAKVREASLAGLPQTLIAKALGVSTVCVRAWQRRMGLPTRVAKVLPVAEILTLYKSGLSAAAIARQMQLPLYGVHKTVHHAAVQRIGRPPKRVDPTDALHHALGIIDGAFGSEPLPFGPEHDSATAAALLGALSQRYASLSALYGRASETDLAEFCGLLTQALHIKRTCSDHGMVVH